MLKWLRRNKDDGKDELRKSMMYAVLAGESQRPISEKETFDDLGINPHLIRSFRIENAIDTLYKASVDAGEPDLDLIALGVLIDGIIRTSRNSLLDSQIGYLKTRRILRRIEMNTTPTPGLINLIEAIELERLTAWNDSLDGWKAKLTKVTPKSFEIAMREVKTKEGLLK